MTRIAYALTLAIVFSIGAATCQAQNPASDSWVDYALGENDVFPNLTYAVANNIELKLDLYLPRKRDQPLPVLMLFHGGGWVDGQKERNVYQLLPYMSMGWAVINVEYRLARQSLAPAAVEDCRCALRWIAYHAREYNLDTSKIVLTGGSAGGHLALITGMLPAESNLNRQCATESGTRWRDASEPQVKVAAIVNWYGITDVRELLDGPNAKHYAQEWFGNLANREELARQVSPINYVRAGLPPIITIHGELDDIVPYSQAVRLHAALEKAGVPNRLITIPGGKHGGFARKDFVNGFAAIREFLSGHNLRKTEIIAPPRENFMTRQMTPEQRAQFEAMQEATRQDHRQMMEQLKITSLRPGANPNDPKAPNAVNYDESKANPYPRLPDPLILKNGGQVTSAKIWWNRRRAEIVEDFDREVYGRVPKVVPRVRWEVVSVTQETKFDIPVVTKQIVGHVDNSIYPEIGVDIQLTLTTPAKARGPVPVMMEFGFVFPRPPAGAANANRPALPEPTWQKLLFNQGWGLATIIPTSVQADNGAGLTRGIIGLVNKGQPRQPDDWGALRAWAWGASRALDYLETDKDVNARQVGIEGLSRYGKAALVTMAYDQRFAIGFIGSSGEGGAKLHRRNFGELVENLAGSGEYHWMAGNFIKYGGPLTASDLPVDAHELIALCAPRPIFISYGAAEGPGAEGKWVDQRGSFMAAVAAGPVYRLLGKKDLGTTEFPPVEKALIDGDIAWRQHSGGHTVVPNWPTFLTFAGRYIKGVALSP